jgi:PAS domain S-box-containing protein
MYDMLIMALANVGIRGPGRSGGWTAEHRGLYVTTDLLLAVILGTLAGITLYLAKRRKDLPFPQLLWALGGFYFACALGYLASGVLYWVPLHGLPALIQVIAALAGGVLLLLLLPRLPKLLTWVSPLQLQSDIAKRTQQLRDSEARLRAIVETAEDGILTLDDDWIVRTANPVCERLFGVPVGEIVGQPFTNFVVGPDSKSAIKQQVGTGEGKVFGLAGDIVGKRADGNSFQASLSMSKIHLDRGTIFTAIIHDVSAFKRTQEALRQSEARLRMMLAQVPAVLCTTDRKLRITLFASSAITGLSATGFHVSRFSGMSLVNATDEILRDMPVAAYRQALDGTPSAVAVRWRERFVQFHVQALRDTEGRIIGAIGIGLDVTEQKRIEAALRRSEATIRAMVEAAGDGILTFQENGLIRLANPACEKLFGYRQDELLGRNVCELIVPPPGANDRPLSADLVEAQQGLPWKREMAGRRQDGDFFPLHLSVSKVPLKKRQLFVGIAHDMTEQKKAEQALQFYARQLQDGNDQLLRSNQELDEFAYVASHDLKEPLRGISHLCTFLIEDYARKLDAEGQAKLERLRHLANHLGNLIDSLLQFSRVGRVDLAVQETNLEQLVEEVVDSLRISLQEQGVEVHICGRLPTIRCDRVRLAEVFRNLITNALKYNDKPHKWIEIGEANPTELANASPIGETGPATKTEEQTPEICGSDVRLRAGPGEFATASPAQVHSHIFYVRDNGIGIPRRHWDAIFRIFKRLHNRDQFGGGTGAGLTIVKKIIERHGGEIFLESQPGLGTTFFFCIPCMPLNEAPESEKENPFSNGL